MVYLTRKTTRGQHYYYLVKSFKYDGRVEKVQQYLGSDEPNETELEQLKQQNQRHFTQSKRTWLSKRW